MNCTPYWSTVTLIFLVIVTVIKGDECPPPKDIEPCSCENPLNRGGVVTCANMYTADQLSAVLRNTQGYRTRELVVINSTMQYIPNSIFEDLHFNSLVFTTVIFSQLFDDVPKDPGIVSFRFTQVRVQGSFDWTPFSGFTKLRFMNMYQVTLRGLTGFKQNAPKGLEDIVFEGCDIRKFRKDEFQDFPKLIRIEVTKDKIKKLERSMFPRPAIINAMIFKENQISSIPEDLFEDMKIRLLEFSNNLITVLPENTYQSTLRGILIFEGNPLKCDCDMKWIPVARRRVDASIHGTCDFPQILKGKQLEELEADNFSYC